MMRVRQKRKGIRRKKTKRIKKKRRQRSKRKKRVRVIELFDLNFN